MPTWFVHGFRWPRPKIRIHIIVENLDDCAPEWLMAPATTAELIRNFQKLYPEQLAQLPNLRFIEQYDPEDEDTSSQPYAYVCDQVTEIQLGVDIDDVRGVCVQSDAWTALVELRDKIAEGEKVGWFVVVNGDVERYAPPATADEDEEDTETELSINGSGNAFEGSPGSPASQRSSLARSQEDETGLKKKGVKKWLGKIRKARSIKDLKTKDLPTRSAPTSPSVPPPVPPLPHSLVISKTRTNGRGPTSTGTA
ncbi:hypothetical protein BU23DRAFT_496059 [Bimuria novae-zelandiae CBS 107.79]|uniref:Developmental regulator n=1 Tax=Bimuria novae-zelandiae CBS 107.79 TaxID=1447943 RepID=A0A6A5VQ74_9PLEO|nr:hypothetical protein BU23DRAFT_496059 [Bimuria novae-zelandiae CBS 107.79]